MCVLMMMIAKGFGEHDRTPQIPHKI